jgi:2-polyprenyl-3-methyl-5-hydroxy-6-metoxy-1,4-benzoquinol methylase
VWLSAIGEGYRDVPALAARIGASERGTRILADYLVVIGLLGKTDGHYLPTPTSAAFLDRRSPASLASLPGFLHHPTVREPFENLTEVVKAGRTTLPGEGSVEEDNPVWVEFAHSMAPMMASMASPLGQIVLADGAGPMKVLDIAAGHGLFGIEVAKQNPQAHIVALDWKSVLAVAQSNAAKAGLTDGRYKLLPGNAFKVDYGGPYDVVLLTNFLHHFDRATCVQLLVKVRNSLKPGGRAAALEFVPNEDRVTPPMAAAFALTMLASTAHGDAYPYSEYEAMYREAGFARTTLRDIPNAPHRVVTGYVG